MIHVYGYTKCSTCQKALKWLIENGVEYQFIDFVIEKQTEVTIENWLKQSPLPIKRFFNTSGMKYRELQLSEKLMTMSEKQMITLLASDGMLIKRPLLVTPNGVFPGFKEVEWRALIDG